MENYHRLYLRDVNAATKTPPMGGVFIGLAFCIPFWLALALLVW